MRLPLGEEGQGLAEYGWSIVLVAIFIVVILIILGGAIFDLWAGVWETLKGIFTPEATEPAAQYLPLWLAKLL